MAKKTHRKNNYLQKTKDQATWTPLKKQGMNSGALEGLVVPTIHVAPMALLLNEMNKHSTTIDTRFWYMNTRGY